MARERCKVCCNAAAACICKWVSPVFNKTTVVILQHTDEVKKPLGTAKIVSLCLQNSTTRIGVDFSNDLYLNQLLDCAGSGLRVLYPSESSVALKDWRCIQQKNNQATPDLVPKTLIVLDGTWRKVARMLHLNPWLSELPCFAIDADYAQHASQYLIRKSPRADGLSTIEAAVKVLNDLHDQKAFDPILGAFNKMIEFQINAMGSETFHKNYSS